jgi:hypothetical protein
MKNKGKDIMKITRSQLKQLIKEELETALSEFQIGGGGEGPTPEQLRKAAEDGRSEGKEAGTKAGRGDRLPLFEKGKSTEGIDEPTNAHLLGYVFGAYETTPRLAMPDGGMDVFMEELFGGDAQNFKQYAINVREDPQTFRSIFIRIARGPDSFIKKYCGPDGVVGIVTR